MTSDFMSLEKTPPEIFKAWEEHRRQYARYFSDWPESRDAWVAALVKKGNPAAESERAVDALRGAWERFAVVPEFSPILIPSFFHDRINSLEVSKDAQIAFGQAATAGWCEFVKLWDPMRVKGFYLACKVIMDGLTS